MVYRQDINGMRAMAIIAVVLYHAFPNYFPGGFLGVDVFFIISGYLVIGKLLDGAYQFKQFYCRRLQKILPPLILVLSTFMVVGYFFLYANEYQDLNRHVMASLLFSNHWLLMHEMGYFDKLADFKPFLHLWSLSIEEQFYLFMPLFIFIFYKKKYSPKLGLVFLLVLSLSYDVFLNFKGFDTYYFPACRLWEFALGGMLVPHRLFKNDWTVGLFIILLLALFLQQALPYRLAATMVVCLTTALLIIQPGRINRQLLQNRGMIYLGLISYPLYLWHWSLIAFFKIIDAGRLSVFLTLGLLGLSVFLSALTYQFLELPIRQYASTKVALLSMLTLFGLGLLASVIDMEQGWLFRPINLERQMLLNDLGNFDDYKQNLNPCHIDGVDLCLKNKSTKPWYVVWGDSHAEHLFSGLVQHLPKKSGMLISTHSCPPLLGVQAFWQGQHDSCQQTNFNVMQSLNHLPSVKVVVLSAVGLFYISNTISSDQMIQAFSPGFFQLKLEGMGGADKSEIFLQGMQQTVSALQKLGKTVIVLEDNPMLPFMPIACLARPLQKPRDFCQLPLAQVQDYQASYHGLLMKLVAQNPQLLIYNSLDALCHEHHCPIIENGHFLYRDSQHLSLVASKKLAKGLLANFPNLQDTSF